jgi:hypothetical protein
MSDVFIVAANALKAIGYRIDGADQALGQLKATRRYHALSLPNERILISLAMMKNDTSDGSFTIHCAASNLTGLQLDPLGFLPRANSVVIASLTSAVNSRFPNAIVSYPNRASVDPTTAGPTAALSTPDPHQEPVRPDAESPTNLDIRKAMENLSNTIPPNSNAEGKTAPSTGAPAHGNRGAIIVIGLAVLGVIVWSLSGGRNVEAELAKCVGFWGETSRLARGLDADAARQQHENATLALGSLRLLNGGVKYGQASSQDLALGPLRSSFEEGMDIAKKYVSGAARGNSTGDAWSRQDKSCWQTMNEAAASIRR